jgi:hypothetical protein
MPSVLAVLGLLPNGGGDGKAFEALTVDSMQKFNEETPDVEGVRYFSWGAVYEPGLIDTWKYVESHLSLLISLSCGTIDTRIPSFTRRKVPTTVWCRSSRQNGYGHISWFNHRFSSIFSPLFRAHTLVLYMVSTISISLAG